eukprot:scaffold86_cov338-Pavlova_lutheri.AAC.70
MGGPARTHLFARKQLEGAVARAMAIRFLTEHERPRWCVVGDVKGPSTNRTVNSRLTRWWDRRRATPRSLTEKRNRNP